MARLPKRTRAADDGEAGAPRAKRPVLSFSTLRAFRLSGSAPPALPAPTHPHAATPPTAHPHATSTDMPWAAKHAPVSAAGLALHPRKLAELRAALQASPRLVVLAGPSGSGKSTAARLVLAELHPAPAYVEFRALAPEGVLPVQAFAQFLADARFSPLPVVVDELPNTYHDATLEAFRGALAEWLHALAPRPMLVVCVSEVGDDGGEFGVNADVLLGPGVLTHRAARVVRFNPIARLILVKPLRAIAAAEPGVAARPRRDVDAAVAVLAGLGDLRAAIAALEFWSRGRGGSIAAPDAATLLFHAVGKIVHGTRLVERDANHWAVQQVADSGHALDRVLLLVLENYAVGARGLAAIAAAADAMSFGDVVDPVLGLWGCRVALDSVERETGRAPFKYTRWYAVVREARAEAERVGREWRRARGRWGRGALVVERGWGGVEVGESGGESESGLLEDIEEEAGGGVWDGEISLDSDIDGLV